MKSNKSQNDYNTDKKTYFNKTASYLLDYHGHRIFLLTNKYLHNFDLPNFLIQKQIINFA